MAFKKVEYFYIYRLYVVESKNLIIIVLFSLGFYQWWSGREVIHSPGILVSSIPEQVLLAEQDSFKYKNVLIYKLANYKIRARVLSTESYSSDKMANIIPVDVAVGWREMSDSSVLSYLNISQRGRFYVYDWEGVIPISSSQIVQNSANMHLVSSNELIEKQIKKLRIGQLITMTGQLIKIESPEVGSWASSLTRDDSGAGACETMWVTSIDLEDS